MLLKWSFSDAQPATPSENKDAKWEISVRSNSEFALIVTPARAVRRRFLISLDWLMMLTVTILFGEQQLLFIV